MQEKQKFKKKFFKEQKRVKKAGFYSIGATIRRHRERLCLLYADMYFSLMKSAFTNISTMWNPHFNPFI